MSNPEADNHESPDPSSAPRREMFPATQWSAISQARGGDEAGAAEGLRKLAANYWRPLYLFLRKRGENHEDASDTVQGFFAFMLSSGFLEHVEREGGKFRSYLLKSLERWRGRQRVREGAQKRGGHVIHVSLDGAGEMEATPEFLDDSVSPELAYDRQWAMELTARAVQAVRAEYERRGRGAWFSALSGALPGGDGLRPYLDLAHELACSEGAVKKGVFDLRSAFATRLREEILATVRSKDDAEEELRYLVSVLSHS